MIEGERYFHVQPFPVSETGGISVGVILVNGHMKNVPGCRFSCLGYTDECHRTLKEAIEKAGCGNVPDAIQEQGVRFRKDKVRCNELCSVAKHADKVRLCSDMRHRGRL